MPSLVRRTEANFCQRLGPTMVRADLPRWLFVFKPRAMPPDIVRILPPIRCPSTPSTKASGSYRTILIESIAKEPAATKPPANRPARTNQPPDESHESASSDTPHLRVREERSSTPEMFLTPSAPPRRNKCVGL